MNNPGQSESADTLRWYQGVGGLCLVAGYGEFVGAVVAVCQNRDHDALAFLMVMIGLWLFGLLLLFGGESS